MLLFNGMDYYVYHYLDTSNYTVIWLIFVVKIFSWLAQTKKISYIKFLVIHFFLQTNTVGSDHENISNLSYENFRTQKFPNYDIIRMNNY